MSEWLPIESAPKDGTWVVVLVPYPIQDEDMPRPSVFTARWVVASYDVWEHVSSTRQELRTQDDSAWSIHENPTHWQPLPETPE